MGRVIVREGWSLEVVIVAGMYPPDNLPSQH